MKRATREFLKLLAGATYKSKASPHAKDILDSDARQRAEIRDLKARLAAARASWFGGVVEGDGEFLDDPERRLWAATDLKNKEWKR